MGSREEDTAAVKNHFSPTFRRIDALTVINTEGLMTRKNLVTSQKPCKTWN